MRDHLVRERRESTKDSYSGEPREKGSVLIVLDLKEEKRGRGGKWVFSFFIFWCFFWVSGYL